MYHGRPQQNQASDMFVVSCPSRSIGNEYESINEYLDTNDPPSCVFVRKSSDGFHPETSYQPFQASTSSENGVPVIGQSPTTDHDTVHNKTPELTINHIMTGYQLSQAATTEYFSTSDHGFPFVEGQSPNPGTNNRPNCVILGQSPIIDYDTVQNKTPEPTIDHSKIGQQPIQAPTTEYYSTSEFGDYYSM